MLWLNFIFTNMLFNDPNKPYSFEKVYSITPCPLLVIGQTLKLSSVAEGPVPQKERGGNKVVEVDKSGKCSKYTEALLANLCDVLCKNQNCTLDCEV